MSSDSPKMSPTVEEVNTRVFFQARRPKCCKCYDKIHL